MLEAGVSSVIVILGHNSDDIVSHVVSSDTLQIVINPDHSQVVAISDHLVCTLNLVKIAENNLSRGHVCNEIDTLIT